MDIPASIPEQAGAGDTEGARLERLRLQIVEQHGRWHNAVPEKLDERLEVWAINRVYWVQHGQHFQRQWQEDWAGWKRALKACAVLQSWLSRPSRDAASQADVEKGSETLGGLAAAIAGAIAKPPAKVRGKGRPATHGALLQIVRDVIEHTGWSQRQTAFTVASIVGTVWLFAEETANLYGFQDYAGRACSSELLSKSEVEELWGGYITPSTPRERRVTALAERIRTYYSEQYGDGAKNPRKKVAISKRGRGM
jgi:hypothetical protein